MGAALGPTQDASQSLFTDGQASFLMGAFVGGARLVIGAVAGTAKRGEKWERRIPRRLRLGILPSRKNPMVAAAISF